MDQFLGFADASDRLTDDEKGFLGKLVLEARRANSFLESSPTNLEDILSFSEMGDRLRLSKEQGRANQLREIIGKVYTSVTSAKGYWDRYKPLNSLLGKELASFGGDLSIVTTNYDLNIESACLSLQAQASLNFPINQPNHLEKPQFRRSGSLYSNGGIPLFKLHGSVNWYEDANGDMQVEDSVIQVNGDFNDQSRRHLPAVCAGNYRGPSAPMIIPPSFLKPNLAGTLRNVWAGAADVLSKANEVAFIGYSFPPSDTEMMYFLARAFSENAGLRRVYLIDPRAAEISARLKSNGSKMGSHFRELLVPIAKGWTDVELSRDARVA